jgi:hypothetical protein
VLWNATKVKLFFSNQQVFEKNIGKFFLTAAMYVSAACRQRPSGIDS